ncbi:MAG: ABC transporter permease [Rhodospirillaceae bacterium]|nr:ABC transporter permease [Rhodospirillaceae bacterium]
MDLLPVILTIITASTPLLLAATGELITEKSGVLNLGVEGMMLIGAIAAFATAVSTGSALLAILAGAFSGALVASVFAVLTLIFLANQVATGLALTIFGVGLSALIGSNFVGVALEPLPKLNVDGVSTIPILGKILFNHDVLVYLSFGMIFLAGWFLSKTRAGLILRAVGESHDSAHALGYSIITVRYLAVIFGGFMSGLGGSYLSLVYTPLWAENMTAGRGWIALALVVFGTWRAGRVAFGAYLFGTITILQLHVQGWGINIASQFMTMLPYIATIVVLVLISRDKGRIRMNAPQCIGKPFHPSK